MTAEIAALPSEVVHLIAAGEVIDSLAAAVRELAENALDAGATRITVSIYPEQWRIRVADNGTGMSLADLQQAAAPHSTSKIRDRHDLEQVASLGFRGEALHSLAQLATLEILSRPVGREGWQVSYDDQGHPVRTEPVALAPGTVVTVDRLFERWIARRQSLPSLAQQLRAVQTTIQQLALCHPHVTWQVQQHDSQRGLLRERDWFQIWSGKTARQILPQILRDVQLEDLQELTIVVPNQGQGNIYLLLGLPDRCHRHRPDWIRVALNGRLVQIPELEQTILASFRRTLPRDRFPVVMVHLQVPPDQIDWNRHPAKSEVYLRHLDHWREQVASAIAQALRLSPMPLSDAFYSQRVGTLLKTAEAEGGYSFDASLASGVQDVQNSCDPAALPSVRALAQVHNTYILAEHPAGVWLVEQHIAHERVLYEQLCDRWQIVPLAPALILNQLTSPQVEQLQRLGLEVEPFGEAVWMVRSAPALLAERTDCSDALLELSLGGDLQAAQVATACRSAIRNGTPLTLPEMQTLLNQWQRTRNPRTCPHGRPICLTLEETALSRFFRRHWVIGKSHGI